MPGDEYNYPGGSPLWMAGCHDGTIPEMSEQTCIITSDKGISATYVIHVRL